MPNGAVKIAVLPDAVETNANGFPIVGIGASAGGLAAFESFFSGMPADDDPGMAFVLVQHLAPDHKSILTELVKRYTRMQVFEVEDGMVVRPNCTYIIPPNRDMAFLGGTLQLLEPSSPRGQRLPIDFFFRSLAQDQHARAIGIVLSGTGSDGTVGIRAIKDEGGMVMAQDPDSTEYDGMPRSAIASGLVDFVLAPAQMPAQLIAYTVHAFGHMPQIVGSSPWNNENALKKIFVLLRSHTGHDFSLYKPSTINRRIERRMALQQIETMGSYVKYAQQTPREVEALFRDLLIGVTNFFRDPKAFEAVEDKVIPRIFTDKAAGDAVRVWIPGCATGEEAYSFAILLAEHQELLKKKFKIQIFATDIDSQAITTARAGLYPASIAVDITPDRLARFFSLETDGGSYRIHKTIRDMLIFSEQDIIKDPPFSKIDLISCRNLLIYMGGDLQKKLIPLFYYALNPCGFLFLGTSETIGDFGHLFDVQDRKLKIYQRKDTCQGASRVGFGIFLPPLHSMTIEKTHQASGIMIKSRNVSLRELTEQELLQQIAPAAALVNGLGDILYIHGRTGFYLEPAIGEVGVYNILTMAREGLTHELTLALHKAVTDQQIVRCPDVRVKTNGDFTPINLTVRPVINTQALLTASPLYLVILEDIVIQDDDHSPESSDVSGIPSAENVDSDMENRLVALRHELQAKEEFLQATNEELRSSNEEMQSINEELQSTNEELETSKEELQSVNEELATVNAELQNKVIDLTRANNDMNNLLAGTGIGTIFVDHDVRILRFTPAVTKIINLIQGDIGRPVGHIVSNLVGYDTLLSDTQAVLDTLVPKEMEVRTQAGMWYAMRIQPYRTLENVIEGAVITFTDITESKQMRMALSAAHARLAEAVVATVREPLMVLDAGLGVVSANRAFYTTFNVSPEDTLGKFLYDLGNGQWKIPALRTLLEDILSRNIEFHDFEVTHEFESIGRRSLRLNARRLFEESGESELILLAIEVDVES
nr:chemotaxis protein CheB [uncultured Desulfobulbus sp.]